MDVAKEAKVRVGRYAWYALFVLMLVYVVNFIDRQIISILAEDIKRDLSLDDAQIGFLYGTAFAVFYALFGIPLARLADSWHRGKLMAIGLGVWSSMTALSGFAGSYSQLAAARIGVGIGEASASPCAYSMISDYFPARRRATAMAIYSAGLYIGGGLSLPIGGTVMSGWNAAYPDGGPLGLVGWQAAFLAVGLPGLLLALWVLTLREPLRGAVDGLHTQVETSGAWRKFGQELFAILPPLTLISVARMPGALVPNLIALAATAAVAWGLIALTGDVAQWVAIGIGFYAVFSWVQSLRRRDAPTWRLIWGTPAVIAATFGFGSISFVSYGVAFWAPPYVIRTFYGGSGAMGIYMPSLPAATEVALILGLNAAVSSAAGVIIGGILSDRWRTKNPAGRVYLCMVSIVLTAPLVFLGFRSTNLSQFYLSLPLIQFFGAAWIGAAVATLQDVVLPRMRATAAATYVLGTTMFGLAIGPYFAGKIAAVTASLQTGVLSLFAMVPFTLAALWYFSRHLETVEATKVERARVVGEVI